MKKKDNTYATTVLLCLLLLTLRHTGMAFQAPQSRRAMLNEAGNCIGIGAGVLSTSTPLIALPRSAEAATSDSAGAVNTVESSFSVYQIMPDASEKLSPSIKPINPENFLQNIILGNKGEKVESRILSPKGQKAQKEGGVIWLGEHHNSKSDHDLQAMFIEKIHNQRTSKSQFTKGKSGDISHNMAIGLEQIQIQFQPVLDAYVQGDITEEEMLQQVEWETRWVWSYENYRSVFALAQRLKIPLIALNVNSEDLSLVEVNGFPGMDIQMIRKYVKEPRVFADFTRPVAYKAYSAYVIEPSYNLHKEMGILKYTISGQKLEDDMPFKNFFSGRILWDGAMAGNAYQWTKNNEGGLMISLVGADHVKFEKGVVGRYQSLLENDDAKRKKGDENAVDKAKNMVNAAVLLNPTLIDSRPSGSTGSSLNAYSSAYPDQITLQLRYLKDGISPSSVESSLSSSTGGVLPLADYIVISGNNMV